MGNQSHPNCGTCIFFLETEGGHGQCWRYPPTALPMMTTAPGKIQVDGKTPQGVAIAAMRPPVQSDTLACGEYISDPPEGTETATGPE